MLSPDFLDDTGDTQAPHQTALPSKLCATLDVRGDCAWTKPGPFLFSRAPLSSAHWRARPHEAVMALNPIGTIAIPGAVGSEFDHAAFDATSRRIFIAHTARDCVEVIDPDAGRHIATLPGFPGVAGAVADDGQILVTNRGSGKPRLARCRDAKNPCHLQDRRTTQWRGDRIPIRPRDRGLYRRRDGSARRCSFSGSAMHEGCRSICRDGRAGA